MAQKIDTSCVTKFDGTFHNIWVHRLTLILKAEKLRNIVNGTVPTPIAPTAAQIPAGTPTLPAIGAGIINEWEEKDTVSLTIINNCLDNSVISHVQSCPTSNLT
jgi:hypothetical protein